MKKSEFLARLRNGLSGLPREDIDERVNFYSEMIDDRMEEGKPEEEAVAEVGNVDAIISQIVTDTPIVKLAKERIKPKRKLETWEIALLIIGSPIWLSVLIAAFSVAISLYASVCAVIISLWAVFAAAVGTSLCGIMLCVKQFEVDGNTLGGIAMIGASFICVGLSIFIFFGCEAATRGLVILTKKFFIGIKRIFIKEEM